jgi:hypothetical protein
MGAEGAKRSKPAVLGPGGRADERRRALLRAARRPHPVRPLPHFKSRYIHAGYKTHRNKDIPPVHPACSFPPIRPYRIALPTVVVSAMEHRSVMDITLRCSSDRHDFCDSHAPCEAGG